MYVCMCVCMYVCMCACMYVCMCMSRCVCIYVYIYLCIHIYIYTYTHTYWDWTWDWETSRDERTDLRRQSHSTGTYKRAPVKATIWPDRPWRSRFFDRTLRPQATIDEFTNANSSQKVGAESACGRAYRAYACCRRSHATLMPTDGVMYNDYKQNVDHTHAH